jgi:Cu2+-exporting ATPase
MSTAIYPVKNMTCAACAVSVQSMLEAQKGVEKAQVNFAANEVLVDYNPDEVNPLDLKKAVKSIGYDIDIEENRDPEALEQERQADLSKLRFQAFGALILAVPVFIIGMLSMRMGGMLGPAWLDYVLMVLTFIVLFVFGRRFFVNAWKQATHLRTNMDTLVALSTGITFLYSAAVTVFPDFFIRRGIDPQQYFESAAVIVAFILLGRYFEERAKNRSSSAIRGLMGMQPKTVTVLKNGQEEQLPIDAVQTDDIVIIRPGDRVPVDGVVVSGRSFVDESMLTGEPVPEEKGANSKVFSGTINKDGLLQVRAIQIGQTTFLAQIVRQVQQAQGSKPPLQKLADKIAGVFVPVVILVAIVTFIGWYFSGMEHAFSMAFRCTIAVLIIACPCALGLATPMALMVGIGRAAEKGLLIKDAQSLEDAVRVNVLAVDKTGTITEGKPEVKEIKWLNESPENSAILSALASASSHPLSQSIAAHSAAKSNIVLENINDLPGLGIEASHNGRHLLLGSARLMSQNGIQLASASDSSASMVYFAIADQLAAEIALSDPIKPSSASDIAGLQKMGIETFMLTGDRPEAAAAIAQQAGIHHYEAGMTPSGKAAFVKEQQQKGRIVAMAGDGINDAAALAQADLSIAMGKGADIAMEAAQLTIMNSSLAGIGDAIHLSKATVRIIRQNLFWAFIYNIVAIPVAAGLLYPHFHVLINPMIAGAAMALSSVSVVANSLRLKGV